MDLLFDGQRYSPVVSRNAWILRRARFASSLRMTDYKAAVSSANALRHPNSESKPGRVLVLSTDYRLLAPLICPTTRPTTATS
jgi:hypothetical protein